MSEYFPKPKSSGGKVKAEQNLINNVTKGELKNAAGVDTSDFPNKVDLANLKSDADKLDIDKLKNVPSKISNLNSKVDQLAFDKLVPPPFDLVMQQKMLQLKGLNIML